MDLLTNRKLAFIILVVTVLFSIFFFGGNDLLKLRNQYFEVYENGVENAYFTAAEQVESIRGQAFNMVRVLEKYDINKENELEALKLKAETIENAKNPNQKLEGAEEVLEMMHSFYQEKENFNLSEKDAEYMENIVGEVQANSRFIITSGYNDAANGFNEIIRPFPANIISGIRNIKIKTFEL